MVWFRIVALVCALLLAGCRVGPDYRRPTALTSQPLPTAFSGAATDTAAQTNFPGRWKPAAPAAGLPKGEWWAALQDVELDRLETLAASGDQNLAAALARLEQSRALVKEMRAQLFPRVDLIPSATRQRTSFNAPQQGLPAGQAFRYDTLAFPADLSWELDLWGRVRRETEGARARVAASAEDLESLRLSVQAEIASDYFLLRALDSERALYLDTIETYRRSLELTQNRRKGGIATDLDVSEADTQLRAAEAQIPAIDLQRANLSHALAVLCGQPATGFQIHPTRSATDAFPVLPPGLPSELLERRPDISAAERRVAAANADVGVAMGAFYPSVTINVAAGLQSVNAGTLFEAPSRFWSMGPTLDLPLFTGGRNRAQLEFTRRAYDEAVANYRQSVLTAFQEVEDQVAAQNLLAAQLEAESAALASARRTLEIANNRYKAGLITYLEVATAQSAALDRERTVVELQGQRRVALVRLIKALGGQWDKPLTQS